MNTVINLSEGQLAKMIGRAMKRITLRENIEYEGGNSIKSAGPIMNGRAVELAQEIADGLRNDMGIDARISGSLSRASGNDEAGDIDILVPMDWDNLPALKNYINSVYGDVEDYANIGLKIYSVGIPYDNGNIVQVDFLFTKNADFGEFMRHQPGNSRFSGIMRGILLKTIAMFAPIDNPDEYKDEMYGEDEFDGKYANEKKTWWRHSLSDYNGLSLNQYSSMGKRGKPVKTPTKLQSMGRSENRDEIIRMILGSQVTPDDYDSWESLVDFLFSGRYQYGNEENLKNIFTKFFQNKNVSADIDKKEEMIAYVQTRMQESGMNFAIMEMKKIHKQVVSEQIVLRNCNRNGSLRGYILRNL